VKRYWTATASELAEVTRGEPVALAGCGWAKLILSGKWVKLTYTDDPGERVIRYRKDLGCRFVAGGHESWFPRLLSLIKKRYEK
jgi:hypothetical protein